MAALSGPVDPGRLATGLEALRSLGFEPVPAANLASRHREMLAGDDAERLSAFHQMVADPSIAAIFFARGGWGLPRLLPLLDWDLLARHPRAYMGYSDLTPLLLGLVQRCGLVAFHGPMVAADLARGLVGDELASLFAALGEEPELSYPLEGCFAEESIEAPLLGGCLSLLAATAGTPFAPDLSGSLLFLEDVGEPAYRLDRMLTQLRQTGQLAAIRGMIVGHLTALGGRRTPASTEGGGLGPLLDVFGEHAAALGIPFAWGLAAGHDAPNLTLPLGALARLDPAALRLSCRFAATVDGPPRGVSQ